MTSRRDFTRAQKRLQSLGERCGLGGGDAQAPDEDRMRDMTPYQQQEYRLALDLKGFRDLLASEAEAKAGMTYEEQLAHPELARIRQKLRVRDGQLRSRQRDLLAAAGTDTERDRSREAISHLSSTRERYLDSKREKRDDGLVEAEGLLDAGRGRLDAALLPDNLEDVGNDGRLRQDQEFQQFFVSVVEKDRLIDQALDRLHVGVQSMHQTALKLNEELKVQDKVLDEVEEKVEHNVAALHSLNAKVVKTVKQVRKENVCIYATLFIIVLALAGYILYELKVF